MNNNNNSVTISNNKSELDKIFKADRHSSERESLKEDYMFNCGMSETEAERAVRNCFAYEDDLLN